MRDRLEIYLQFDGLDDATYTALRGEALLETKLAALEMLRQARPPLHARLHRRPQHQPARGRRACCASAWSGPSVRGVSYQLATYCGRHLDPRDLEQRATMPDVVKAIVAQTGGLVAESDFYPLPCAIRTAT